MPLSPRAALLAVALLAWTRPAFAQRSYAELAAESAVARARLAEGVALLDAGRVSAAMEKFEESLHHEDTAAALIGVADCYRLLDRTASAWGAYHRAEQQARSDGDAARAAEAARRLRALDPRLARLSVVVKGGASTRVLVLGKDLPESRWGAAIPMDPGTVRVEASAPGKETFSAVVELPFDGGTVEVVVPELQPVRPPERPRPPPSGYVPGTAAAVWPAGARVVSPPPSSSSRFDPVEVAGVTLLSVGGASALTGFFVLYTDRTNLSENATITMASMLGGGALVAVVGYIVLAKHERRIGSVPGRAVAVTPLAVKRGGGLSVGFTF